MRATGVAAAVIGLALMAPLAAAWADDRLAGRWIWRQPYVNSELVLNADGTGSFDGDALIYSVRGGSLVVTQQGQLISYRYRFHEDGLLLWGGDIDGEALLQRARP